jgi:hypothetical protein
LRGEDAGGKKDKAHPAQKPLAYSPACDTIVLRRRVLPRVQRYFAGGVRGRGKKARALLDSVGLLSKLGAPEEVFGNPKSERTKRFLERYTDS